MAAAAAASEISEELRAGVLTKESLFQRALLAWDAFVRRSILKEADECCTQTTFTLNYAARRSIEKNVQVLTSYAKIVLDIAKDGGLDVFQRTIDDHNYNYSLIQSVADLFFAEGHSVVLIVCWD